MNNNSPEVTSNTEKTREVRIEIDREPYHSPNPTTGSALYRLATIEGGRELIRETEGDREDELIPNDHSEVRLTPDEHFYSEKEFHIFVNTKPRTVPGPKISFEQVLQQAGFAVASQDLNLYDVEWVYGNRGGTLSPGQTVRLKEGMRFDAGKSNRS